MTGTTRVFCVASAGQLALLAAAIDTGRFETGRRVLLVADEAPTPEVGAGPLATPGADALLERFDEVRSVNELIAPLHPAHWQPPATEQPLLTRLLAPLLGADELVVESITDGAGRALAALLPDATITLARAALDTYAPALRHTSSDVTERVERLLYLDLLPDLAPRSLPHSGVRTDPVPVSAFRTAVAALTPPHAPAVVLLGGAFAKSGLLTATEQSALHAAGVRALAAAGVPDLLFAPHPAADPEREDLLAAAATETGVRLTTLQTPVAHEAWLNRPDLVLAGWAEPALLLAERSRTFDLTGLLDRPGPYERPDRMALTIVDAVVPKDAAIPREAAAPETDLALLVDAVSFCLDPSGQPQLRERAQKWVDVHGTMPYLRKKRLAEAGVTPATSASSPAAPRRRPRIFRGGTASR